MRQKESKDWLLLMHQLPPQPDSFRVRIWRSLQKMGALSIKNSVYVLPNHKKAESALKALLQEIQSGGGEAFLCHADFLEGVKSSTLAQQFNQERDKAFKKIAVETGELLKLFARGTFPDADKLMKIDHALGRMRRQLNEIVEIDYLHSNGRARAQSLFAELEQKVEAVRAGHEPKKLPALSAKNYQNRVWVTRKNLFVDRLASAWLIKRFIDKSPQFKFIDPEKYKRKKGELTFDMFDADFGHHGDLCTFETLLHAFHLQDEGLIPISEIIHDIDLNDEKYNREETSGIHRIIKGLASSEKEDAKRLARASNLFDDLHSTFSAHSS